MMYIDEKHWAFDVALRAAADDLRLIVQQIVTRYVIQQRPLTWALLHDIECEARADLGLQSRHDATLLRMLERVPASRYPCTDELVNLSGWDKLPIVFSFARDTYARAQEDLNRVHRLMRGANSAFDNASEPWDERTAREARNASTKPEPRT